MTAPTPSPSAGVHAPPSMQPTQPAASTTATTTNNHAPAPQLPKTGVGGGALTLLILAAVAMFIVGVVGVVTARLRRN